MQFFKKTIYNIAILSAIICAGSFIFSDLAQAQDTGNLSVVFTPDPLFQEVNFLPGSSAYGSAQVSNNSGEEKPIAVEAINITNDKVGDGQFFGDVLELVITENSTELFNGTVTEFFNGSEIYLSNLENGASATYGFTITFNGTAENKYQEKNLGFDILIGFQGEEGGGTTSGGGGGVRGLSIHNEYSKFITDTTATIIWFTSYKSTSRVIYCKESQNCTFDFSDTSSEPPLYGYKLTTIEQDNQIPININGVTYHKVEITGLAPSTTYYYRTVSHASPPTISKEYSFTTLISSNIDNAKDVEKSSEEVKVLGEETMPALEIKKGFESEVANPGDIVKYQIEIVNNGNFDALDVVITEELSEGLTFESDNKREQIVALGNIKPDEIRKVSYTIIVDKSIAPGIYIISTKLSALNHNSVEKKIGLEIRNIESSQNGKLSVAEIENIPNDLTVQKKLTISSSEQEKAVEPRLKEEKNKTENTREKGNEQKEEIKESNIKEWLFWILLIIIVIELYILISKTRKKDDKSKDKDENNFYSL